MTEHEPYTVAEVVRSLKRVEAGLAEVRTDLRSQAAGYVTRAEFQVWRDGIGRELREIKSDVQEVRAEAKARQMPWTAVGALAISALTFVVLLIQIIPPS
ncbi:hypothetical protein [uncultured Aeromicrobium sp.]|uniref:hypothetical protein n=1 Tax=uncultured Aeromicrobium sp. TaxID=337820 RepID=UPI00260057D0|nr:hypothetical protein [uncultured Aeromicrobium sp.]